MCGHSTAPNPTRKWSLLRTSWTFLRIGRRGPELVLAGRDAHGLLEHPAEIGLVVIPKFGRNFLDRPSRAAEQALRFQDHTRPDPVARRQAGGGAYGGGKMIGMNRQPSRIGGRTFLGSEVRFQGGAEALVDPPIGVQPRFRAGPTPGGLFETRHNKLKQEPKRGRRMPGPARPLRLQLPKDPAEAAV